MNDQEQRLIDLETKISFQDKSIDDLSDALYIQQQKIAELEKTLKNINKRIESYQNGDAEIRPQEKPPHY